MKQYLCIKEYATLSGDIAYKKGKIYDLDKNNRLVSELSYIALKKGTLFFIENFKKHKPLKSFGGNGLYDVSQSNSRVNGIWTGEKTHISPGQVSNVIWVDEFIQKDSIVESVIKKFKDRSDVGIKKYGTTLDRTDVDFDGWAEHLQQELMDGILYLERLKKEYETTT